MHAATKASNNAKPVGVIDGAFVIKLLKSPLPEKNKPPTSNVIAKTFAMAGQRNFFSWVGKIHPKFNTPGKAIMLHLVWMILMVISGSFNILADMYIFIVWVFNIMLMYGLFILRKKMPDAERPYKVVGYPVLPALYIVLASAIAVILLIADTTRAQSISGLVIVLLGVPVYFIWRKVESAPAR